MTQGRAFAAAATPCRSPPWFCFTVENFQCLRFQSVNLSSERRNRYSSHPALPQPVTSVNPNLGLCHLLTPGPGQAGGSAHHQKTTILHQKTTILWPSAVAGPAPAPGVRGRRTGQSTATTATGLSQRNLPPPPSPLPQAAVRTRLPVPAQAPWRRWAAPPPRRCG